jgi:hypothetical protein
MSKEPGKTCENLKRKAEHARRLAKTVSGDEAEERLLQYAKELEDRAAGAKNGECRSGNG